MMVNLLLSVLYLNKVKTGKKETTRGIQQQLDKAEEQKDKLKGKAKELTQSEHKKKNE